MKPISSLGLVVAILAMSACGKSDFGRTPGPGTTSDERIASYKATLVKHPNNVEALNGIGDEHARWSSWEQAAGSYKEALIVDRRNRKALLGYSASQSALGRYDTALTHANRAMERKRDIPALIASAIALNGQGRHGEAVSILNKAMSINPRDLDVRNNLALTLAMAGDPKAYDMQRSVAFAPDADFRHRRNLYLVAAMTGREASAQRDGRKFGIPKAEISKIFEIGRRARSSGVSAFGIASQA